MATTEELDTIDASFMGNDLGSPSLNASPRRAFSTADLDAIDQQWQDPMIVKLGQDNPSDIQKYGRGVVGGLSKLIPFNVGDEIIAGGTAGLDYLRGNGSLSESYNQRLNEVRNYQDAFAEASPKADLTTSLGGAFLLPIGGLASKGVGLPAKAGILAGEGAAIGAGYGFGAGEGLADRLSSAETGAKVGAIAAPLVTAFLAGGAKALSAASRKAASSVDNLLDSAMGAVGSDFTKSARQKSPWVNSIASDTETGLRQALRGVRDEGVVGGSAQETFNRAVTKSQELSKQVDDLIVSADAQRGAIKVFPKLKAAQELVESAPLIERPALLKRLDEWRAAIKQQDGSIQTLQAQKKGIYEIAYPEVGGGTTKALDRAIARDLKNTIEAATDATLPAAQAGQVRALNKRLGNLEEVKPIFERNLAKAEAATLDKGLVSAIKTTGGYASPVIAGGAMGGIPGAIAGAGVSALIKGLGTPTGKTVLANTLRSVAPKLQSASNVASSLALRTPSVVSQRASKRDGLTQRQLQSQSEVPPYKPEELRKRLGIGPSSNNKLLPKKSQENIAKLVETLAEPNLRPVISAIIKQESAGNPKAISKAGAQGVMQLMPQMSRKLGVSDPFNPEQNIQGGIKLFKEELNRFNSLPLALAAYNAGSPRVNNAIKKAGSRDWEDIRQFLPKETRDYVSKIARNLA